MNARTGPVGESSIMALATCATATASSAPAGAIHAAKRCLLDWLGVAVAGADEMPAAALRDAFGVAHAAAVLGAPTLPAHADALLMGTAGHVLDYDDTDAVNLVHVSASVVPALIATARRHAVKGTTLLQALVAAYEVEAAIGRRLGRPLTARGWHVSGVLGHAGAAVAAALAQGLSTTAVAQAIAIAATGSSGFIAAFGTMSKSLQLGRTASGGVLAAELAARDFTGPLAILDAPQGWADTLVGMHVDDWGESIARWGAQFAIQSNSFKPHAACMITHPAIDAALVLRAHLQTAGVSTADITRLHCRVNPLVPKVAGHRFPASGLQGKFSVAYCVVVALLDGRATPDRYTDAALARPDVSGLLECCEVVIDDAVGEQQAEVSVDAADGRTWRQHTAMAKGHPANPMTDDELSGKFFALAEGRVRGDLAQLVADVWRFEFVNDVGVWLRTHLDLPRQ